MRVSYCWLIPVLGTGQRNLPQFRSCHWSRAVTWPLSTNESRCSSTGLITLLPHVARTPYNHTCPHSVLFAVVGGVIGMAHGLIKIFTIFFIGSLSEQLEWRKSKESWLIQVLLEMAVKIIGVLWRLILCTTSGCNIHTQPFLGLYTLS